MRESMRLVRMGIDTYRHPIAYMRADCPVCRSEGFEALSRVEVRAGRRRIEAVLNVVDERLLQPDELGLSEAAFALLGEPEGAPVTLAHPPPLTSFSHVRAKIYGQRLTPGMFDAIIGDVARGRYPDVHIAAFLTACADNRLDREEVTGLTRAMLAAGERLSWGRTPVVDKHCVGGLPGNRTTPIVVAIVAAHGLTIPKTSSRAITSPAGTADVVDTFTRASLSLEEMRRVVEREGGCLAWGGAVKLAPVDDLLIRVEQPLDIDSEGQLIASVLSKKISAGSTHVVIDIPVGPTAKVRSAAAAQALATELEAVGAALGLRVRAVQTDGSQPVGWGVGPALEARDVLAVLRGEADAPADLRDRAVWLAGQVIGLDPGIGAEAAQARAAELLASGQAWRKLLAISEAQGGFREPAQAEHRADVAAHTEGKVAAIDNRRLARVAKLAGAPVAPAAGLVLRRRLGERVEPGAPLFTVHAHTRGELAYALDYVRNNLDIVRLEEP